MAHNSFKKGEVQTRVDADLFTFVNNGCNGTDNTDFVDSNITESTADPEEIPDAFLVLKSEWKDTKYNPAMDRQTNKIVIAHRPIPAGGEVLGNYLTYLEEADWEEGILQFRAECSGVAGPVEQYQRGEKEKAFSLKAAKSVQSLTEEL
jgi:hypothetical protein